MIVSQDIFQYTLKKYITASNVKVIWDIFAPEYEWAMKMDQWPMPHTFTCKNQDFDGPFEILMGHLEEMMGPRNLNP